MKFPGRGERVEMLNYLSKFVLQMLPTISATVIGAYIVTTWINPKTPPAPTKIAGAQEQKPAKVEPVAAAQPAQGAAAEPVEAKPAEMTAPAETAKPVKGVSAPEKVRVISLGKQPAQAAETAASTASIPAPSPSVSEATLASDERKDANRDANELARAAILRLRGSETARPADEPAKPPVASVVRTQPVRVTPEAAPLPVATVAPPLPPAVSIGSPRIAPGEGGDQAAVAYPDRVSPPAEIPAARNPLNLQASARIGENPSFADDVLSATKSFFRAITP